MTTKNTIWIVDDDRSIRFVLERTLQKNGFSTESFNSGDQVLETLKERTPNAILTDIRMPGIDGLELLERVREQTPHVAIVVMTAHSDLESTITSFKGGAFEYLAKPFDIEEVTSTMKRALSHQADLETDAEVGVSPHNGNSQIVGRAPAMQEAFRAIARLSQSIATVLITGETGTGKELVATALHENSPRSLGPFLALNMAALPNELIEAELFGHEKGAFTGATSMRTGRFEQANGGTLFLDEIGDMPIAAQTRLLRVLSEGSFYRVGGRQSIQADTRIIAATHQELERNVADGRFREDLYHRLNVIRIHVPPLRQRRSDIEALALRFMRDAAASMSVDTKVLNRDVIEILESLDWPGNVRQLENTCHWLTVMAPGREVGVGDLPPELLSRAPSESSATSWQTELRNWVDRRLGEGTIGLIDIARPKFERTLLEAVLAKTDGVKLDAARVMGWGRNTIRRKINELEID